MGRLKKYYNDDEKRKALNEASHRYYLRHTEEKNKRDLERYYRIKAAKNAQLKISSSMDVLPAAESSVATGSIG